MNYFLLILLILSPKFNISNGITLSLLDFLPALFIMQIFFTKNTKIYINFKMKIFITLILIIILTWSLSTIVNIMINISVNSEISSSIKSILQLYRRFVAIVIIPLYVFYLKGICDKKKIIKQIIIILVIEAFISELINISPFLLHIYMSYIANSHQTFLGYFFRNMGFVGEATYFANLLAIALLFYIYIYDNKKKIYIFFIITGIFFTFSKSTYLSLIVIYIVSLIYNLLFIKKISIKKQSLIKLQFGLLIHYI